MVASWWVARFPGGEVTGYPLNSLVQLSFTSVVKGKYLCTFNTVVVILHQNFDMAYYFVTVFCQVQCQWFPFLKFELEKKSE